MMNQISPPWANAPFDPGATPTFSSVSEPNPTPDPPPLEWFKSLKGRNHLVSVVYFPEAPSGLGLDLREAKFKRWEVHYDDRVGFVHSRLGKDDYKADKVWESLGPTRVYYSTLLLFYPALTGDKKVDLERLLEGGWELHPWRLGSRLYQKVRFGDRQQALDSNTNDLRLICTNSTYQNFDVFRMKGGALWRQNPELQAQVLKAARPHYSRLAPFQRLTTEELKVRLEKSERDWGRHFSCLMGDV